MYTCELCGKQTKKGYMMVNLKSRKAWVICRECGEQAMKRKVVTVKRVWVICRKSVGNKQHLTKKLSDVY